MKRENLEEARRIVNRLRSMEEAIEVYDKTKENEFSWCRLFINLFRNKNKAELDVMYKHDNYIEVSMEQQEELANLIRKWIEEDKKKLETL